MSVLKTQTWQLDKSRPFRSLFLVALFGFAAAVPILAVFMIVTTTALIVGDSQAGFVTTATYTIFMGFMFVLTSAFVFPLMLMVVPYVLLIPAIGAVVSLRLIQKGMGSMMAMFFTWMAIWMATFFLAIYSGKISV